MIDYKLILFTFIAFAILNFIVKHIISFFTKKAFSSKNKFDDYLVKAFVLPIKFILWLIFIYFLLIILHKKYNQLTEFIIYFDIIFIFFLSWLLIRVVNAIEKYFINETNNFNKDMVIFFARLIKLGLIIFTILITLQYFGFSVSSILTFGGVGGMVIGFAAKDILANIFGGLMISLDKPFSVGDWVRINDVEGTVEHIGWRMTQIRTFSKNPVYVPNSMFSTQAIETPSRMTNRRIYEKIGICYDNISVVINLITQIKLMLDNHKAVDKKALTMVYFNHFAASSLELVVYTFTKTTNWEEFQQIKGEILLQIASIIDKHKAQIAYPTRTLHIKK